MIFRNLSDQEFKGFIDSHELKSFYQTKEMDLYSNLNGSISYYVGIEKDNKIVAATRLVSKKNRLGFNHFYSPRGLVLDYNDEELLKFFVKELKKFIKKKCGYVLHIDPLVIHKSRDINGDITNELDNTNIVDDLLNLGFKHNGFTKGYDLSSLGRWYFVLNLENKTIDDISKDMKANHRNIIRKAQKYGVEVKQISYDDLDTFKYITENTSNRVGFKDKSLLYYQTMYKAFKDDIKFMIAYLNIEKYKEKLNEELEENNLKYEKITDKEKSSAKELKITIDGIKKRLDECKKYKEKNIPISCAMYMLYGDEVSYLFSGSLSEYKNLYAQYLIQWHMINYAIDNKYKIYNFYGISGIFDKKDKDYGVYEFKKGFGGEVVEFIGDFYLPTSIFYYINKIIRRK